MDAADDFTYDDYADDSQAEYSDLGDAEYDGVDTLSTGSGHGIGGDDDDEEVDIMSDDDMFVDEGASVTDVRAKPYEVEFRVLTVAGIEAAQQKEIEHIAGMFAVSEADAAVLLRHFHWNKERLIELYMDAAEDVKCEAGIAESSLGSSVASISDFTCEVCFMQAEDYGGAIETVSLTCGHCYCKQCYQHYAEQKVREEGESGRIQCMNEQCNLIVDEGTMSKLLPPDTLNRYRVLLDRAYVDDNQSVRWCPAPDCELAVECHVTPKQLKSVIPSVRCGCGHWFCFGCGLAAHQPVICAIVKLWLKKCEDDSETVNWISANTKACPKCDSTIEKNGGCNHMNCRKCRHEFCWMCSGPWSEHGNSWYHCNRYDEKAGTDARDSQAKSRVNLERYLHYFNRYANHEQSARLDRELYKRIEKKMDEMQVTSDLSWIEVQFLKKAADTLTECRMTLKWTYCMVYYLERNNMTELFEDNQRFGAGLMGAGIAQVLADVGKYKVTLSDVTDKALENGQSIISKSLSRIAKKKMADKSPEAQADFVKNVVDSIKVTTDAAEAVQDTDLVIEAIIENMKIKQDLFAFLDTKAPESAIFASNTSSLSITEVAQATHRQKQFAGFHAFNPVPQMKLIEVVRTEETSSDTTETLVSVAKKMGKAPVTCIDSPGFIVNRLLVPYQLEAIRLVERGVASPEDVDTAMKLGAGYPMGPFELADLVGLDTLEHIARGWRETCAGSEHMPAAFVEESPSLTKLIKEGKLGRKAGEKGGFYSYAKPGSK
ncbi:RBR-type E3 ubiquitin transferase [Malassezia sp. CBS 17886]|nr:RBR-type E3 ubiquitin transferase [Malassezia sp. CBS 17886]